MPSAVNLASPAGTIQAFGGTTAPSGWILCNGASLNRADYPALFAAIGTAYGTASGTVFNVPDLRGRFLRGVDSTGLRDPNDRGPMATGGNSGANIGSAQSDAFQGHYHEMWGIASQGQNPGTADRFQSQDANLSNTAVRSPVNGAHGAVRFTTETRPLNASVNFIIKY